MRSVVLTALALLALASPTRAQERVTEEQVRALLSGYEQVPGERTFRALGPGTAEILIGLHEDRTEPGFVRLRALGAVAHFPSPRTRAFLVRVAGGRETHPLFVRQAVLSLGRGFGRGALAEIVPFLEHEKPIVRRAAARALTRMRSDEADKHVRARLEREPNAVLRRAIRRRLRDRPD